MNILTQVSNWICFSYTILVRQNGNETSELANTVTVHTGGFYTVIIQPNVSNTQEVGATV